MISSKIFVFKFEFYYLGFILSFFLDGDSLIPTLSNLSFHINLKCYFYHISKLSYVRMGLRIFLGYTCINNNLKYSTKIHIPYIRSSFNKQISDLR